MKSVTRELTKEENKIFLDMQFEIIEALGKFASSNPEDMGSFMNLSMMALSETLLLFVKETKMPKEIFMAGIEFEYEQFMERDKDRGENGAE